MGSWLINHGALCYHNNKLAANVECFMLGRKRRGKGTLHKKKIARRTTGAKGYYFLTVFLQILNPITYGGGLKDPDRL